MEIVERSDSPAALDIKVLLAGLLGLIAALVVAFGNPLLFHTLVEGFSIVVATLICVFGITTYRYSRNSFILFLGNAYIFVAIFHLLHLLTYEGMQILPDYGPDVPTQIYVAGRYVEAISLFLATFFFIRRSFSLKVVFPIYAAVTLAIVAAILWFRIFPACFVPGQGLTTFKIASEYAVALLVAAAMLQLYRQRQAFSQTTYTFLSLAMATAIPAELALTFYSSENDLANVVGHILKVIAYYLIYRGVVARGLQAPYEEIQQLNHGLERRVAERTVRLEVSNKELEEQIRARKRAEAELRKEHDFSSAVVDTVAALVVVLDRWGRIVRFNRACERLTGYSFDEVRGKPLWDLFILPEEYTEVRATFARLWADQFPSRHENLWRTKGGDLRLVEWSNTALADPQGFVEFVIGTGIDVTERKQAEEVRSRLAAIVESSQDAIYSVTLDGTILSWNPGAEQMYGYAAWEVLGKSIFLLTPPDRSDEPPAIIDRIRKGEQIKQYETVRVRKDGRQFDVSASISPLKDSTGRIVGVSTISHDITEEKLAREALAAIVKITSSVVGEEFFRSLVRHLAMVLRARYALVGELTGDGTSVQTIAVWTGEGYAENFVYDLPGTPCEGVVQQQQCYYSSGIQQLFPMDRLLAEMGVESYWGTPLRDPSGNTLGILVALSETPMAGELYAESTLQIFGMRAAAELKRKQIDEALRESKQQTVRILEILGSITDPFLALDDQSRLIYLNPQAEKLFSDSTDQLLGRRLLDSGTELRLLTCHGELERAVAEQVAVQLEGHYPPLDRWFEIDIYPYQKGTSIYLRDVTKRKGLEEQLRRAQRLEAAGRVAAQVGHDLGNALAPLAAYPDLIKRQLPHDHPASRYCDDMVGAVERMATINRDLLALGRRGRLEQEPTDVNLLVKRVLGEMLDRPDTLSVVIEPAEDLLHISGSPAQLGRVVANLVRNARDAMHDAGTLAIRTENVYLDEPLGRYNRVDSGEYVKLSVSDQGRGILPEIRDRIFDAFFSTKSADEMRGSGLGLSIVQSIVDDHRGYVDLVSEVGRGTTFSVYLPVLRDFQKLAKPDGLRGGTETLLVVDDDPSQRLVARKLMEALGYRVEEAESGERALAHIMERPADLLILDMVMPGGIGGAETYSRVLELRPGQPALLMSGSPNPQGLPTALALGAFALLLKPLTLEKLAAAVRAALD